MKESIADVDQFLKPSSTASKPLLYERKALSQNTYLGSYGRHTLHSLKER
jgi:hypothetical protein